MHDIKTLVFCDFETTGLPAHIGRKNVQITELSLVSVSKRHFEETGQQDFRLINKLCLCVQPRSTVSHEATEITGLCNIILQDEERFSVSTATLISNFVKSLKPPVCLVAHNGYAFDFPLLAAELRRGKSSLEPHVLCVDSLLALKDILSSELLQKLSADVVTPQEIPRRETRNGTVNVPVTVPNLKHCSPMLRAILCSDTASPSVNGLAQNASGNVVKQPEICRRDTVSVTAGSKQNFNHVKSNQSLQAPVMSALKCPVMVVPSYEILKSFVKEPIHQACNGIASSVTPGTKENDDKELESLLEDDMEVMMQAAEMEEEIVASGKLKEFKPNIDPEITPQRRNAPLLMPGVRRKSSNEMPDRAAVDAKKRLVFDDSDATQRQLKRRPVSYKLVNLYRMLFGIDPEGSHRSEFDTLALMRICHKVKDEFLTFAQNNSVYFHEISPMW